MRAHNRHQPAPATVERAPDEPSAAAAALHILRAEKTREAVRRYRDAVWNEAGLRRELPLEEALQNGAAEDHCALLRTLEHTAFAPPDRINPLIDLLTAGHS